MGGTGFTTTQYTVSTTPTGNTFQLDFTPAGVYIGGGTVTLYTIHGSKPDVHISSSSGLAAPLWVRDNPSETFVKSNHFCSIDNSVSPPLMRGGNYACQEFTLTETSLSETAFTVTAPGISAALDKPVHWSGWAYYSGLYWVIDDGVNPLEVVRVNLGDGIVGDVVTFVNSGGARTLMAGTRSAHSGTIKLRSFGRGQYFSNPR